MPICAQWVGGFLPLTNYIRIMRCIMLKGGADLGDLQRDGIWLARLMLIAMAVAVRRVRHTLD